MRQLVTSLICAFALHSAALPARAMEILPAQVVVVANSTDPDSLVVAKHYLRARGVPERNLIALPMPREETIGWPAFVSQVWEPLQDRLIADGWIDALPPEGRDNIGRRRHPISGHRIGALVLCRGVPLRVQDDPNLAAADAAKLPQNFRTNAGAVDSELSLLAAAHGYLIESFTLNPLFNRPAPTAAQELAVVKVARLDGPTAGAAEALVDSALAGERLGLSGRAYIDLWGHYPQGDRWLHQVANRCEQLGFETSIDRNPVTFPLWSRFEAPVLYFGWYSEKLDGPFALPGFSFPPGAIAVHIHSFSAHTLRSDREGWCGPLVARGVAATLGNVWEPYLQLSHRPDLFFAALAAGSNLVDAAYYALPALSWAGILIGDPLYRPFARRPASGNAVDPPAGLGAALSLAQRLKTVGKQASAVRALEPWLERPLAAPGEWGTFAEAADLFTSCQRSDLAERAYQRLLAIGQLPLAARAHWLVPAQAAASAARDPQQAEVWRQEGDRTKAALAAAPSP